MKIYLANGLFSTGDRIVNEIISTELRSCVPGVSVYVPQENESLNDKYSYASSEDIAKGDCEFLDKSDLLIAVIDGSEIDSGVAAEIGRFSVSGKPIIGLYTDIRQKGNWNEDKIHALMNDPTENQFMYKNLFVMGLIKQNGSVASTIPKLLKKVKHQKALFDMSKSNKKEQIGEKYD